ncbi:unnamed protein product [Diamesa hyperborea]
MKQPTSPTPSESGSYLSNYSFRSGRLPRPATSSCSSATNKVSKYLRRLIKFNQLDFEYALWQMLYLFVSPQKVFRNFGYRKETKSQFARDDPAFLVLLILCLCVTSLGFVFIFNLGFSQTIFFILYVVVIDFLVAGLVAATSMWLIANKFLKEQNADGDIEWGYSFDVHINAFFPPLVILHFIQLIFYKVLFSQEWFLARFMGNTLWLLSIGYYIYITFLGYNCISLLKKSKTKLILAVLPIVFLMYIVTIAIGWNLSVSLMNFYHYRVL